MVHCPGSECHLVGLSRMWFDKNGSNLKCVFFLGGGGWPIPIVHRTLKVLDGLDMFCPLKQKRSLLD